MKQEKELLLKDLCCRLPYGVKVNITSRESKNRIVYLTVDNICHLTNKWWSECKPYLFPLSSMTEEQLLELKEHYYIDSYYFSIISCTKIRYHKTWHSDTDTECSLQDYLWLINWFNKNHFDYRGLIEKGLAIDCTGLKIY